MTITKTHDDGKLKLSIVGRLDKVTAPQLQEALIPAFDEANEIMLDFSGITYVSSAGLRVLLTGHKTAKAKGAFMTLSSVSEDIMEVLDMTGFSDMLDIV